MWKTKFTKQFPARLPMVGASMAGVSGGELSAETCRAGALGFIAAGHLTTETAFQKLEEQIQIFRNKADTEAPLCIGWISFSSLQNKEGFRLYEQVLEKHKPAVVQFFAPCIAVDTETGKSNVEMAKEYNVKVLLQVGNVEEGIKAIQSGADGIIAQGSEAGGHGLRREMGNGTLALAARIVKLASQSPHQPVVLAAGGISDGRGVAAALALGCDGAVLGTRLWASKEAMNKESLKNQLVLTKSGDGVTRTIVFDQIINHYSSNKWPKPYDSVGALRNKITEEWDGRESEIAVEIKKKDSELVAQYKAATQKGDPSIAQVLAGEGVGEIDAIETAYDIIVRIEKEARDVILKMSGFFEYDDTKKRKHTEDPP